MTGGDRWVIFFLIFAGVFFFLWKTPGVSSPVSRVQVGIEGRSVLNFTLNSNGEQKKHSVDLPKGEAVIEVKNGAVRLLPLTDEICPRHICSQTGWISRPGETIVCVPNRLVIRITNGEEAVDAVSR